MRDPLSTLLERPHAPEGDILVSRGASTTGAFQVPGGQVVSPRELSRMLQSRGAPTPVVVVDELGPQLLRTLREHPPGLLALVAGLDELSREPIARLEALGTLVLGPYAQVSVGAGEAVHCAHSRIELAALDRVGDAPGFLSLCPTPPWLPRWLDDPSGPLAGRPVLGFVAASLLHLGWARWYQRAAREALTHGRPHPVVVPLGVREPPVDAPGDPQVESTVAAHALEALTGPVFPAPRVIHAVSRARALEERDAASSEAIAMWSQARRALPLAGASEGMERPCEGLSMTVPTAAFLAQRALLRRAQATALLADPPPAPQFDEAMQARSLEVLRSAGEALSEHESKVVLRGFGIEITRQAVASSASGAAQYAEKIGFPVVLKAVSPDLRRKRELGGVILGRTTSASVRRAYATILHNIEQHAPTARLDGVLVAEQISEGLEIECGAIHMGDEGIALHGRAVGVSTPQERVFALTPLAPDDALLFAHAILSQVPVPALRRRVDPSPKDLAELFLRLDALTTRARARLLVVELSPVRLIHDPEDPRRYVTLDARIVQRPHLDGI
ncbi:MAG: acetate--CoA ligase family protein [Myxococcales bacterium]|nr:acetate--CoA ligase family protein [Myxococcales bacterium]